MKTPLSKARSSRRKPRRSPAPAPTRILLLSPHPDDETIGCGGCLRQHALQGHQIKVVFLTSGEHGGHGRTPKATRILRQKEARRATALLGVQEIDFWEEPDGALSAHPALVERLVRLLRRWRPHRLYVPHDREMHPDHRAACQLAERAFAQHPPSPPEVFCYEVWTPLQQMDLIVDITAQMKRKLAAMRAYRSQCAVVAFDEAVAGLNRYRGELHCWPEGDFAEVFARPPWSRDPVPPTNRLTDPRAEPSAPPMDQVRRHLTPGARQDNVPAADTPLVSIIITNYNYGRYLGAAIESALAQSWPNLEVIAVDDGSTDDSRTVLSRYKSRITTVHKSQGGQASACNAGYVASRGEFILFLDADDVLAPNAVAVAMAAAREAPVVRVHWPMRVIDADGKLLGRLMPGTKLAEGNLRETLQTGGPSSTVNAPTSGNVWRRTFLQRIMPIPEDVDYYRRCSDEFLYSLAPFFGHVRAVAEPQGCYRVHGHNAFAGRTGQEQLQIELAGYDEHCAAMRQVLQRHGIAIDLTSWRKHSWHHRLDQAHRELQRTVPTGSRVVLIDDETWNAPSLLPTLRIHPFLEHCGEYWGPPTDGQTAVEEVKRLTQKGVRYVALAWSSFWWLESYPELAHYLESSAWCPLRNERLILFDLQQPPATTSRFSIIINNFNYGRYLAQTIESALQQTSPGVEVIVVDDGSTDNSREVIESYGHRIRAIWKDNGGQGSTYNAGFAACRGEFVCFLDADDALDPTTVERALVAFSDPEVAKVQWPLRIVDETGRASGRLSTQKPPPQGDLRQRLLEVGPLYDFLSTHGAAYRRSFLDPVLPMPEAPYRNGADVYLLTLAPVYGRLTTLAEPGGIYRHHGSNHYQGRALDQNRVRNYLHRFETNAAVLAEHLRRQGEHPDCTAWGRRNFNALWPRRLLQACQTLSALIPPDQTVILVNDADWNPRDLLPTHQTIPFRERNGEYWGPPEDDAAALLELQRLKDGGAVYIVFWWTSFWWLQTYPVLSEHLRSTYRCLHQDDGLVVFALDQVNSAELPRPSQMAAAC